MNKCRSCWSATKHWLAMFSASIQCGLCGFVIAWVGYAWLVRFAFSRILNLKFVNDRFWWHCTAAIMGLGFAVFPFATLNRHVSSERAKRAALVGILTTILLGVGVFGSFYLWDRFFNDGEPDMVLRRFAGLLLLVTTLVGVATCTKFLLFPNITESPKNAQSG